jgi:F0F1-type ATP synthase epsilon subunit
MNNQLNLSIRNREEVIFQGKVTSFSSHNEKGKFDVLPKHANFISLLNRYVVYKTVDGQENSMPITNGIIKVTNNEVRVYLGVGE